LLHFFFTLQLILTSQKTNIIIKIDTFELHIQESDKDDIEQVESNNIISLNPEDEGEIINFFVLHLFIRAD